MLFIFSCCCMHTYILWEIQSSESCTVSCSLPLHQSLRHFFCDSSLFITIVRNIRINNLHTSQLSRYFNIWCNISIFTIIIWYLCNTKTLLHIYTKMFGLRMPLIVHNMHLITVVSHGWLCVFLVHFFVYPSLGVKSEWKSSAASTRLLSAREHGPERGPNKKTKC